MTWFKVCGITRTQDAETAHEIGAHFLGINRWNGSPRYVPDAQLEDLLASIPKEKRIWVDVQPDPSVLRATNDWMHAYQLHFDPNSEGVQAWLEHCKQTFPPERLWLAPKLPSWQAFQPEWIKYAQTFVIDTYQKDAYGGTGKTGDWQGFRQLMSAYPDCTWVLAGGLKPANMREAWEQTRAHGLDFNSGVEQSPGIKETNKMQEVSEMLQQLNQRDTASDESPSSRYE